MIVSGMSGNEAFCLAQKGYAPGEIVVGNSVCSLGLVGGLGAIGRGLAGGELANVTELISEGRHKAIERMEAEAARLGAQGVTSVVSDLRTLSGYMEFLSQGSAIHGPSLGQRPFSTSASGMEFYCQTDAGYTPVRFAMGNVAFALGIGRGVLGSVRRMARGEVTEFSQMYNHIRHLALERLRKEAAGVGANAVVDIQVRMLPWGPGSIELLMTGTASHHDRLTLQPKPDQVVTSELTGEELWNLARMGLVPVQLVMATSVYSLGVVGGIGSALQGLSRGELPELTKLVYEARERCLDLLRQEAERFGAEQVVGNKLAIRELAPGLLEIMALGTAVRRAEGFLPATPALIPQAIIVDRDSTEETGVSRGDGGASALAGQQFQRLGAARGQAGGCIGLIVAIVFVVVPMCMGIAIALIEALSGR